MKQGIYTLRHSPLCRPGRKARSGMTLVEVVTAVILLVLFSGALFALLSSILESRGAITDRIRNENTLIAWDRFFRSNMQSLDKNSVVLAYADSSQAEGISYQLKFINTPFRLGPYAEYQAGSSYILETRVTESDSIRLQLVPYPAIDETGNLSGELPPITLLDEILAMRFEFYDALKDKWQPDWDTSNRKPNAIRNLVELKTGETHEIIVWIPHA